MKKYIIITLLLSIITALSAQAWQDIQLGKRISITNISNIGNMKKITVKTLDTDGIMSEVEKTKVSHELTFWGIKCETKEGIYYGSELYGENNQIIHKFVSPQAFNPWMKININDKTDFHKILYDNVCK